MADLLDHINSPAAQKLRKAIVMNAMGDIDKNQYKIRENQIKLLLEWAAEHCYEFGYEPDQIELIQNEFDYGRSQGMGISTQIVRWKEKDLWNSILYFFHKRQQKYKKELAEANLDRQVLEVRIQGKNELLKLTGYVSAGFWILTNVIWIFIHNNF